MKHTLKVIGYQALKRLLSGGRFRPQNPEDEFGVTESESDFDLDQQMKDGYTRDHHSGYRSGQDYAVWGIELGYKYLALDESAESFLAAIITQVVFDDQAPLPTHFIVKNWWNSDDHGGGISYIVFRLSNGQDQALQHRQQQLPTPVIPEYP